MSVDVQKELEAKFDELFGSFDDDNNNWCKKCGKNIRCE